jgi:asparagine synthase (glutamine-hydrolysing)
LDSSAVKKVWGEHQKGFRDRSTELWTLFMFRLWQSKFLSAA